jgi:hypothetical protein
MLAMVYFVLVFLLIIWLFGSLCILLGMILGYRSREMYNESVKEVLYMKAINEDLVDKLNIRDEIIRGLNGGEKIT